MECKETPITSRLKTTDKWQAETAYDSSWIGSSQNGSIPSVLEASERSPFEVHEEMKKQNMQNRIEIKTLEDEDFDEMDDCEIEVEEMNVILDEGNSNNDFDVENLLKDKKKQSHNEKYKDSWQIREMILNKVPDKLRGSVWRSISGNPASISQDYYQLLVAKGDRIGEVILKKANIEKSGQPEYDSEYLRTKIEYNMMAMKPGVSHEDSIAIIENDLPRTFSTLEFYNQSKEEGVNHVSQLRRILRAFTVMRPDVGYVQGMSYLAGFLLLENSEYQTFILFHNLLIKSQILSFYKFKADEIIQRLKFFRQAFLVELPELWEYFEEEKIDPRSYVYEWIMTIYTRALPMNVAKRVWDLFFIDGFPLLFKTALAILKIIKDKIIYSNIEDVMNTLKSTQSTILDEELLIKTIEEVKLPDWVYEELKDL